MATRQDAWTKDEDLLLAQIVLQYIREGKTQMSAFKEVGKRLSRTPQACGFRWNANLRKQYDQAIQLAKKQRKKVDQVSIPDTNIGNHKPYEESAHSFDQMIHHLQKLKDEMRRGPAPTEDCHSEQIDLLRSKVEEYEQFLDEIQLKIHQIKEKQL
ncbi:RsfA family transcriptional regulator [Halalkalibacillus sediminis]|uniref:RsfA family transcriptional regulator n=1 Tax=Halalkalibacillus sediminis TaxID=2018042 RepID=A0A2I0QW22_9BACI|nr:RsfA family transcriptional regulator [Halalkalibacillus sediminis]PKR78525.1 RsfA family transcriptional regulator [Halalkalibacillus sediminis]